MQWLIRDREEAMAAKGVYPRIPSYFIMDPFFYQFGKATGLRKSHGEGEAFICNVGKMWDRSTNYKVNYFFFSRTSMKTIGY